MDSETRDRFMHKTQENVNRLIALISDITAITKLDNGEKLINVTDVNFHDLVFTLSNDFEESNLFEGKMTLSFDVPLNCEVFANEALLTGIISNLTRNAMLLFPKARYARWNISTKTTISTVSDSTTTASACRPSIFLIFSTASIA